MSLRFLVLALFAYSTAHGTPVEVLIHRENTNRPSTNPYQTSRENEIAKADYRATGKSTAELTFADGRKLTVSGSDVIAYNAMLEHGSQQNYMTSWDSALRLVKPSDTPPLLNLIQTTETYSLSSIEIPAHYWKLQKDEHGGLSDVREDFSTSARNITPVEKSFFEQGPLTLKNVGLPSGDVDYIAFEVVGYKDGNAICIAKYVYDYANPYVQGQMLYWIRMPIYAIPLHLLAFGRGGRRKPIGIDFDFRKEEHERYNVGSGIISSNKGPVHEQILRKVEEAVGPLSQNIDDVRRFGPPVESQTLTTWLKSFASSCWRRLRDQ